MNRPIGLIEAINNCKVHMPSLRHEIINNGIYIYIGDTMIFSSVGVLNVAVQSAITFVNGLMIGCQYSDVLHKTEFKYGLKS